MLPRTARSHEAALRGASRGAGRCSAAGNPAPCSLHHAMIARGAGRRHGAGATFRIGWRRSATRSRRRCLCQSKNRISWSFHGGIPPRVVPLGGSVGDSRARPLSTPPPAFICTPSYSRSTPFPSVSAKGDSVGPQRCASRLAQSPTVWDEHGDTHHCMHPAGVQVGVGLVHTPSG